MPHLLRRTAMPAKAIAIPLDAPRRRYGRIPCGCVCRCEARILPNVCFCPYCMFSGHFIVMGWSDGILPCRCPK